MPSFALITEGITDQIIIENILFGFYNSKDIFIEKLQPKRDTINDDKATTSGNWDQVFKYCESADFRENFETILDSYVIIHIDADVFFTGEISEKYRISVKDNDGVDLNYEDLYKAIQSKLVESIGKEVFEKYEDRIVFAIAVNETECWLLPIYYDDKRKAKTVNCINTINPELKKKLGFTIAKKNIDYYRKAAKPYLKHKTIISKYAKNPSLNTFIENLEKLSIDFPEEDEWI